ncbi:MAG: DUF1761 domain-containing protein [Caulobacteraceae bacterium]|nr:DUF1761 domain-containing protein [Caulobacteraceae bacterium]
MKGVNWAGVVVAAVVVWLVGYVWYDMLFGAAWLREMHMTEEQAMAGGMTPLFLGALNTLVMCLGLGLLVPRLGDGLMAGVKAGLLGGIFFAATNQWQGAIYGGDSNTLLMIDVGYILVGYAVGGAIIGALRFGKKSA